jgi:hypothetical protein
LDESLLSVSKIDHFVVADDLAADNCDEAGLDLGLVAAFRAESSMGFMLVLRVALESMSESNPNADDDD